MATQITFLLNAKDKVSKKLGTIDNKVKRLSSSFGGLALKLGAALGAGALIKGIVDVNMEFDKLEAQLGTFTNSAEQAAASLNLIREFTAKTPFQLAEVTAAFTRLLSMGLAPTTRALTAFGDIAAGTGRSMEQVAEAVADATVGEFERLKAFGIKVKSEGDKVSILFKGVTRTVQKNAIDIKNALIEIGEAEFGGAMAARADTMEGAISNLKDSLTDVARAIGEAGMNDAIIAIAKLFKSFVKTVMDNTAAIKTVFVQLGTNLIIVFKRMAYVGKLTFLGIELIARQVIDAVLLRWRQLVEIFIEGYNVIADYVPGLDKMSTSLAEVATISGITFKKIEDLHETYKKDIKLLREGEAVRLKAIDGKKKEIMTTEELNKQLKEEEANRKKATDATNKQAEASRKLAEAKEIERKQIEAFDDYVKSLEKATRTNRFYVKGQTKELEIIEALEAATKSRGKELSKEEAGIVRRAVLNKQASESIRDEYDKTTQAARRAAEEQQQAWEDAAKQMESAMSNFFFDIMQGNFTDLGKSFKRMIDSMVADFLASELKSMFFGVAAPAPTGAGSGSAGGGFLGGLLDFFKADGGPVRGNQPYIVGERGPELFIPSASGDIVSNGNMNSGMGNTVNINIQSLDGADTKRVLERERRFIAELVSGTQLTYNIA